METLAFWIVFILFTLINIFFVFYKSRNLATVFLHLVIMCVCCFIGATQMLDFDVILAGFFMLISVMTFLVDVLLVES